MSIIYFLSLILVGIILMAAGIVDLIKKEIGRGFITSLAVICIIGLIFKGSNNLFDMLGGLCIGLCAVGISMASREQIGRGDGMVICAVGALTGFRGCLAMVCLASLIMAAVSIVILLLKKGNRYTKMPFIPALFAGYAAYIGVVLF